METYELLRDGMSIRFDSLHLEVDFARDGVSVRLS